MRKTIDFTEKELKVIKNFQQENSLKSFSESVRAMVIFPPNQNKNLTQKEEQFAMLAEGIVEINDKVDIIMTHFAPSSPGEVK